MTLIATAKEDELAATIALLPLGLSEETKVGLAVWVKDSSEIQGGKYKGWIDMGRVSACFEEIGSTVKDISAALSSGRSCPVVMEPNETDQFMGKGEGHGLSFYGIEQMCP